MAETKGDSGPQRERSRHEIFPCLGNLNREFFPGDSHENDVPSGEKKKKKNHGYEESPHSRDGK